MAAQPMPKAEEGKGDPTPIQPPQLSGRGAYSVFVGFMKFLLPALAAGLVLLIVAWPNISIDEDGLRIGIADISPRHAENLSMMNARLTGIDKDNQPFTITADEASQDRAEEDIVELQQPKADITLQDGTWLALTAALGHYRRDVEAIDLTGDVNLFHDDGFEARTESARVDLQGGTAQGSDPISGHGPAGTLDAEGFRILDRGARIIFTGRSRLVLFSETEGTLQ